MLKRSPVHIALVVTIVAGLLALDYAADHADRKKYVQAGFDYGKKVGRILGQCETLAAVARANPDSEWTANTADARKACAKVEEKHAPGTEEVIHVD